MSSAVRRPRDLSVESPSATQLLRDDHRAIQGLRQQYAATDVRAREMRAGVLRALLQEIELHGRVEDELFYPAAMALLPEPERGLVAQARQDHAQMNQLIAELRMAGTSGPAIQARLDDLLANLDAHLRYEEAEIIPRVERREPPVDVEGERFLVTLGRRILKMKEEWREPPDFVTVRRGQAA